MDGQIRTAASCIAAALLLTGWAATSSVQAGAMPKGDYAVPRTTVDGGGGQSSGGGFSVHGTLGQADASPATAAAEFAVSGGFWVRVTDVDDRIFADSFDD